MYALRVNASDVIFEKTNPRQKLLPGAGYMIMDYQLETYFLDGNVNYGSYLDILNNFVLPQMQDFFSTQFENGSSQRSR